MEIEMAQDPGQETHIRTTFRLPKVLHKAIRKEAADTERDMTDIILEQLWLRYPEFAGLSGERLTV